MYMKKFIAEKFVEKFMKGFDLHIAGSLLLALLAANFLLE